MPMSERSIEHVLALEALDSRGTPTVACEISLPAARGPARPCPSARRPAATRRRSAATAATRYGGAACARPSPPSTARSPAASRARHRRPGRDRRRAARARRHARLAASARTRCWRCRSPARWPPRRQLARRSGGPRTRLGRCSATADGQRALGRRARRSAVDVQDVLVDPSRRRRRSPRRSSRPRACVTARRPSSTRAATRPRWWPTRAACGGLASNEEALELAARHRARGGRGGAGARRRGDAAVQRRGYRLARKSGRSTAPRCRARSQAGPALSARLDRGSAGRGRLGGVAARHRLLGDDVQLLGDDLFATSPERLARGIAAGVANAVLVKPNQAGTLSDARKALELAQRGVRDRGLGTLRETARTAGSPTWRSAGAAGRSRSARRSAPSARRSGTACCGSRPSAPARARAVARRAAAWI